MSKLADVISKVQLLNEKAVQYTQTPTGSKVFNLCKTSSTKFYNFTLTNGMHLFKMFPFQHTKEEIKSGLFYLHKLDFKIIKNSSVFETCVGALIFMEVIFWFFVGESIGRLSIEGYYDHSAHYEHLLPI